MCGCITWVLQNDNARGVHVGHNVVPFKDKAIVPRAWLQCSVVSGGKVVFSIDKRMDFAAWLLLTWLYDIAQALPLLPGSGHYLTSTPTVQAGCSHMLPSHPASNRQQRPLIPCLVHQTSFFAPAHTIIQRCQHHWPS
jgi:hypothetical protein